MRSPFLRWQALIAHGERVLSRIPNGEREMTRQFGALECYVGYHANHSVVKQYLAFDSVGRKDAPNCAQDDDALLSRTSGTGHAVGRDRKSTRLNSSDA